MLRPYINFNDTQFLGFDILGYCYVIKLFKPISLLFRLVSLPFASLRFTPNGILRI